jgi:hypothetical protein
MVAGGVDRLVKWDNGGQVIWNCIECTHIGDPQHKATPEQVRFEVWSSIIHGSHGLIYFVHQFKPVFREAALFDDAEMLKAVTALNQQVASLAPVFNAPVVAVTVKSESGNVPVDAIARINNGTNYIIAAAMRGEAATAEFSLPVKKDGIEVNVIGENRTLNTDTAGVFKDDFAPWAVHIYSFKGTSVIRSDL